MSEIDRWFSLIPSEYDTRKVVANPNYTFFNGPATATATLRSSVTDFIEDQAIATADGEGLDRLGLLYDLGRPSWMDDEHFRTVLSIWASEPRCTLQAIKKMFDAWTQVSCTIADRTTDPSIPKWEIWLTPPADFYVPQGRGFYPGIGDTFRDGFPVESAIASPILPVSETGFYPGLLNDHIGINPSRELVNVLDRMRAAGTVIVWK